MINFTPEQETLLQKLTDFMLVYNQKVNLTAITEPEQIRQKHFIDSAYPLLLTDIFCSDIPDTVTSAGNVPCVNVPCVNVPCVNVPRGTLPVGTLTPRTLPVGTLTQGAQVIDIGSGAGFPGVIWKILRPDLKLTLLDSLRKRTDYLELLKKELNIEYKTVHARSEELSLNPIYREKYNVAVSRAVANLPALSEYCLPFVKVGGLFLAMKGADSEAEAAGFALKVLGGKIREVKTYTLPSGDKRSLVIIEKISKTPKEYPRQRVNITKKPLC